MKHLVNDLLNKEMDRKQFLQFVGGAALMLAGVSGVLKSLRRLSGSKEGFGGGFYGRSEN